MSSFGKLSTPVFCTVFVWIVWFFDILLYEVLIFLDVTLWYMICKDFLPLGKLLFHFLDCFLCHTKAFYFDVVPLVSFCLCILADVRINNAFWHSQDSLWTVIGPLLLGEEAKQWRYSITQYYLECQDFTSHELDDSDCMKIMGKFLLLIS